MSEPVAPEISNGPYQSVRMTVSGMLWAVSMQPAKADRLDVVVQPSSSTMVSFRVDDDQATAAQRWADELGIDKSELLREALHRHLTRLWGPAEDWADWAHATR